MHITEQTHDQTLILTIGGRLNLYSRRTFQAVLKNAENTKAKHVVLDLTAVDYLDSVALGALALAQANLSLHEIEMSLVGPQGPVREVLQIANIPKLIPVYASVSEALGFPLTV